MYQLEISTGVIDTSKIRVTVSKNKIFVKYLCNERIKSFNKVFEFPSEIDKKSVKCEYKNLKIVLSVKLKFDITDEYIIKEL